MTCPRCWTSTAWPSDRATTAPSHSCEFSASAPPREHRGTSTTTTATSTCWPMPSKTPASSSPSDHLPTSNPATEPSMSGLEDLYREIILDHYRNPRNRGELDVPPATLAEGFNPLCGDEIKIFLE